MPATFISDDEDHEPTHPPVEGPITMTPSDAPVDKPPHSESEGVTTDFAVNPTVIPSDDQDGPFLKSDQAALMLLHEQLGHCSFAHLKQMAEQGIIPRKLAKVPPPKCPSCLYGKAHRKPWRTHKIDPKIKPTTIPGAVVSIDQLESPFRASCPLQKGNQRSEGIEARRCSWIMPRISRTFTCTNTSRQRRQSTQNMRSSASPNSTEYEFSIAIVIMEDLPTKLLSTMCGRRTKQSPFVASVRITKMASLNGAFGTSPRTPEPPSSMQHIDGPRP